MWKRILPLALAWLLAAAQAGGPAAVALAQTGDARTAERAKTDIRRAGLGEKARVRVELKDGSKRKGYVAEQREREFVLRDHKTGAPSIIAYDEVAKVERGYGHSPLHNLLLGTGIGLGAALLVWGLLIGAADD